MNGESYRFKDSVRRLGDPSTRHRPTEAAAPHQRPETITGDNLKDP